MTDIYAQITELMGDFLPIYISTCTVGGLLLGTVLEFIGYGVFKAMSLLNIK